MGKNTKTIIVLAANIVVPTISIIIASIFGEDFIAPSTIIASGLYGYLLVYDYKEEKEKEK